jgi:hypothetical protein
MPWFIIDVKNVDEQLMITMYEGCLRACGYFLACLCLRGFVIHDDVILMPSNISWNSIEQTLDS